MNFFNNHHPLGILLCICVGLLGIYTASISPLDSVTLAILIGAVIGNTAPVPPDWKTGIVWSEKKMLGIAIAMYGLKLDFNTLTELGFSSMLMVICTITVTLLLANPVAKLFKVDSTLGLTIAIGTAICGSAAIGATKDIIKADEAQAGMGIAVINFLGTLGIFLLPILGIQVLNLNHLDNGFLLGNTLQAVGQVVAASFSVDEPTGEAATVVKMGRVLMLTPLIFLLLKKYQSKESTGGKVAPIPKFVLGFIAFSIIGSLGVLPDSVSVPLKDLGKLLLIISMGGIGLKISLAKIREYGLPALWTALVLFVVQIGLTILMLTIL